MPAWTATLVMIETWIAATSSATTNTSTIDHLPSVPTKATARRPPPASTSTRAQSQSPITSFATGNTIENSTITAQMKYSRSPQRPSTTRQIENFVLQIHGTLSTVIVGMNQ